MDRRETLKSMLAGSVVGGLMLTGCDPQVQEQEVKALEPGLYGRTPKEKARDAELMAQEFLTAHELETIAVLCDLILPATPTAGSATQAGVPEFIEFIVKDMEKHQLPIRGGLMWLDHQSNTRFANTFKDLNDSQQRELLDEIAYPDSAAPEVTQGVKFFKLMRNLVLTGYYTTKMGIEDLGYQGNTPNVWDGVPDEVLKKHNKSYDPEWVAKCVDQSKRNEIAQWDDEGNLIS